MRKNIKVDRCAICGHMPNIMSSCSVYGMNTHISCCGYDIETDSYEEAADEWNRIMGWRKDLMKNKENKINKANTQFNAYEALVQSIGYNTSNRGYHKMSDNSFNIIKETIRDVIFNAPVTVILWNDGTKTIVRAQDGETYDPEKGMAMAIAKKYLGNKGNYYDVFKKYLEDDGDDK